MVVAAASEAGGVVVNGMSMYQRESGIANSALVVNVGPQDFGTDPLAGMEFQRYYEKLALENAYAAGPTGSRAAKERKFKSIAKFNKTDPKR